MQFSIRTLLVAVTLIAVCLTADRAYDRWYASRYEAHYLYSLLRSQVKNGDRLDDVVRQFPTAVKIDPIDPNIQRVWNDRRWAIQPGDEIWNFKHNRRGVYIQFRDGRVVNYPAGDYADPDAMARLNNHNVPSILIRYGSWLICILVLIVGGVLCVATDRWALNRKITAQD